MAKMARLTLGVVYPAICLALGLGTYVAAYSDLPKRITVVFDTSRAPMVSIPASVFIAMMSAVLFVSASICCYIAAQRRPFNLANFQKIASHGGFFLAISAFLTGGAAVIHKGLADWHNATGPGWWLIVVIASGLAGASGARLLTKVIYEQLSGKPVKDKVEPY